MSVSKVVTLIRCDNRLVVDPPNAKIVDLLKPQLTFTSKRFLYGVERQMSSSPVELSTSECFAFDHKGRLGTSWGFFRRISKTLKAAGFKVQFETKGEVANPDVFVPRLDRLTDPAWGIELRYRQDEVLAKMLTQPNGCFDLPTAYGKSKLISLLGILLPKARIDVVTKRIPVLRDRLFPELSMALPSVGIVGGGKNVRGKRIMLYSAGSLHHSPGEADIMIGDECHELAADVAASKLARYTRSRNFGLSATQNMRLDSKDLRVEAIFGPVIMKIDYAEAQGAGIVVPIKVMWRRVSMDLNPCEHSRNPVIRKRYGIWRNEYRNEMIRDDAREYGEDVQCLIPVETIEHGMHLKRMLPEYELVYSEDGLGALDRRTFVRDGYIGSSEPLMTAARRARLTQAFESGKLKKVIATTVWNVGVDFKRLAVILRADAGGSPINDVQIPGRAARLDDGNNQKVGIVRDYVDTFDSGFKAKSTNRRGTYESLGWEQVDVDGKEPTLWSDKGV